MKKLLVSASAIALLATPALAQNNQASVEQTGVGAVATVDQTGANSIADVTQSGGGTVDVDQSGTVGSTATVTTSADDRPPESTVDVDQTDDGTAGTAAGQANVATVRQQNVNGFGLSGTGSTVAVSQTHNAAGAGSNTADITQGHNAVSGQVTVSQEGGENSAIYASTTSTDNDAFITQSGVGNNADVQQDFQNGAALATVNQNNTGGADNDVFIDQISAGFAASPPEFAVGADAAVTQDGFANSSTISQTGYSETAVTANFARNFQTGDNLTSLISQSGVDNSATVTQTGSNNDSEVLQGGDGNLATVSQGASGNVSDVSQGGNGNTVSVVQN